MASSVLPVSPPKTILITCFGTRGDVQPFVNLGRYLQRHETMFRVSIVTHLEFEPLVREAGLGFEPLKRSLVRELQETEEGKRLKLAKPWNAMSLLKGFIRPIMLET